MPIHAAIVTLFTVLLLAIATAAVGRARSKFGIKAPATTGPIDFERVFRAHMNTLEAAVIFFAYSLAGGYLLAFSSFTDSRTGLYLGGGPTLVFVWLLASCC